MSGYFKRTRLPIKRLNICTGMVCALGLLQLASHPSQAKSVSDKYTQPAHIFSNPVKLPDWELIQNLKERTGGWWPTKSVEKWRGNQLVSITRGDPNLMEIALTFDDGPHPPFTQKLLALLKRLKVPATFFLVGWKVDEAPYIPRLMLKDGDVVANHTYHHFDLKLVPPELAYNEISLGNDAIRRACGITPRFFRPSGGQFDPAVINDAAEQHLTTVLWTTDPADYVSPGKNVIMHRILSTVRPGSIILLHDGMQETYDILPTLVKILRSDGYRFVTIAHMADHLIAQREASNQREEEPNSTTITVSRQEKLQSRY